MSTGEGKVGCGDLCEYRDGFQNTSVALSKPEWFRKLFMPRPIGISYC